MNEAKRLNKLTGNLVSCKMNDGEKAVIILNLYNTKHNFSTSHSHKRVGDSVRRFVTNTGRGTTKIQIKKAISENRSFIMNMVHKKINDFQI
ncbi:MAG: hypothetical protein MJ187_04855 [Alphaproteobacteria bacterium]|nr:hypothetical protein [Alphaproteobacteria bacterium]